MFTSLILCYRWPLQALTSGCWCSRCHWWGRTCRCHCSTRSHWPQTWIAPLLWSGESWRQWRSPHRPCCPQQWSGRQGSSRCWCSHLKYDIEQRRKVNSLLSLLIPHGPKAISDSLAPPLVLTVAMHLVVRTSQMRMVLSPDAVTNRSGLVGCQQSWSTLSPWPL